MTPSLEVLPTKAKEAPSPHEVRLAPLGTNSVFQSLGEANKLSLTGSKTKSVIFKPKNRTITLGSQFSNQWSKNG